MLKSFVLCCCVGVTLASLSGCFQAHSDDSLRTVPATNNPHIIQDSNKTAFLPGMGY